MKDNSIIINDRQKVYIFQLHKLLKPEDIQHIREQLKKQIQEGCVLLPAYISLVNTKSKEQQTE